MRKPNISVLPLGGVRRRASRGAAAIPLCFSHCLWSRRTPQLLRSGSGCESQTYQFSPLEALSRDSLTTLTSSELGFRVIGCVLHDNPAFTAFLEASITRAHAFSRLRVNVSALPG